MSEVGLEFVRRIVGTNLLVLLFAVAAQAAGPSITSLSVTSGPVGTSVTITGTNFGTSSGNNVKFNGTTATTTSWNSTTL